MMVVPEGLGVESMLWWWWCVVGWDEMDVGKLEFCGSANNVQEACLAGAKPGGEEGCGVLL